MVRVAKQKKPVQAVVTGDVGDHKEERSKALDLAVSQIEKQFGKGSIMKLNGEIIESVQSIPTGALSIDMALGIGGVPRGRVVEIFGPESSGKTTLTLSIINQTQKKGGTAAFIDAENAFDATYAQKIGVNLDDLLISQPDSGEQALEIVETLVRSNAVDVIVVDSVAALVPRSEIEGEMGQPQMGVQARLMSQALRKLSGAINKSKTCVIFINQIREKIGVMFGNPETTPGGRALKFYSSVRIDIRRKEYLKTGDTIVGSHVLAKIVKNKVAPPFRKAEFDIIYSEGISFEGSVIELGVQHEVLQKQGAWFSYGEMRLGQGRESTRLYLKDNRKLVAEIVKKIKEQAAQA